MLCPECGSKTTVKDTVLNREDAELYRRHVCRECKHTFYTIEFETEPSERFESVFKKLRSERVLSYNKK